MDHEEVAKVVQEALAAHVDTTSAEVQQNQGDSRGTYVDVVAYDGTAYTLWIEIEEGWVNKS